MNNATVDKVIALLKGVKALEEAKRNDVQTAFLTQMQQPDTSVEAINAILKTEGLQENLQLEIEDLHLILELSEEEWKGVQEKIASGDADTNDDPETPPNTEEPTIPLNIKYYNARLADDGMDVIVSLKKVEYPAPDGLFLFLHDVQKTIATIKHIYKDEAAIKELMTQLLGIVSVGGTSTYYEMAKVQLENLKKDIILKKGAEIKNSYLRTLGVFGVRMIAVFAIILIMIGVAYGNQNGQTQQNVFDVDLILVRNCLYTLVGCVVGAWLSFAIQKREFTFEDLRVLYENKQNPLYRLIVVMLIAFVFYVMFTTSFFNIEIADTLNTKEIDTKNKAGLALLVGLLIGLAEKNIASKLTSQVEAFVSKI